MKNLFKLSGLLALAVAFAAAPALASAASITSDGMALAVSTDVNTGVDVNLGGVTTASSSAGTDAGVNIGPGATGTLSGSASLGGSSTVTITNADAQGAATIDSASQVSSDDDFAAYAKGQMQQDANLSAVTTSPSTVAVTYKEPAYFLGLFPASLTTTAEVNAGGYVMLSHPWYSFLYSKRDATEKAELEASVQSTWDQNATASGSFSAADKARILAEAHAVLAANADASATASTTTSVSASY